MKRAVQLAIMYERWGHFKLKALDKYGINMKALEDVLVPDYIDPLFRPNPADVPKIKNTWETLTPSKVFDVCFLT